jgi:hypothetical protein
LQLWGLLSSGAPVAPLGMFCPVVDKAVATAMLAFLYIPTVIFTLGQVLTIATHFAVAASAQRNCP